jgi:hypothetical protein
MPHGIPEPAVIRRIWVGAHECIIDYIIAGVDLLVSFTLIVIPNPSALSREHGSDGQQPCHLARLEDAALGVDERNALAAELKTAGQIGGIQDTTF